MTELEMNTLKTFPILSYFSYEHLPANLQVISKPFADLAFTMADRVGASIPETAAGLRHLLEAKDCAVRADLSHTSSPFSPRIR